MGKAGVKVILRRPFYKLERTVMYGTDCNWKGNESTGCLHHRANRDSVTGPHGKGGACSDRSNEAGTRSP